MFTRRAKANSSSCSKIALAYLQPFRLSQIHFWSARRSRRLQKNNKIPYFGSLGSFKVMMLIRLKSSSLVLVVISNISRPVCNRFHARLANNGKITTLEGTALWCPRAQVSLNIEGRDLDRWNLRSMIKISYATCFGVSVVISAQFALEMCLAAQNRHKIHKPPYFDVQCHSKSLLSVAIESPCRTSY